MEDPMEEEMEEVEGDRTWFVEHFKPGARDSTEVPPRWELVLLVNESYNLWTLGVKPENPALAGKWVWEKLEIPMSDGINWAAIVKRIEMENWRLRRFVAHCKHHDIYSGDVYEKLCAVESIRCAMREFLTSNAKFLVRLSYNTYEAMASDEMRTELEEECLTLLNHDTAKLNAMQRSYIRMLDALSSYDLRRADGDFYQRHVTQAGVETQSYTMLMSVDKFVDVHTGIHDNFAAWKDVTDSGNVYPQVVTCLTNRIVSEARELEENHHLRSYEGDAYGLFSGGLRRGTGRGVAAPVPGSVGGTCANRSRRYAIQCTRGPDVRVLHGPGSDGGVHQAHGRGVSVRHSRGDGRAATDAVAPLLVRGGGV